MKFRNDTEKKLDEALERLGTPPVEGDQGMEAARDRVRQSLRSKPALWSPLDARPVSVWKLRRPFLGVAAAAMVIAAVLILRGGAPAVLETADGPKKIEYGEIVSSGGVLALRDGSRVEMRTQSELHLERAPDGVRICLSHGSVIVNAAKQGTGHLYVQTSDVTVSVVGTVFYVNAEEEGSRVAVIEGEVRVQQGATSKSLRPGEQLSTNPRLESHPVKEEISWSESAPAHIALLQQAEAAAVPARPVFDVASVRPSPPTNLAPGLVPGPQVQGGPGTSDPGRITYKDIALSALICDAYGVRFDQVSGPGWPYTQRFDIIATLPAGATKEQLKLMEQNLLADRFNLQLHHESRILSVYALTVAKSGLKLKESAKAEPPELPPDKAVRGVDDGGYPTFLPGESNVFGMPAPGHMRVAGQRVPISKMLGVFRLDHPVVDQTELTGEYDFKLDYAFSGRRPGAAPAPPVNDPADLAPTVFEAVESQLGLKLTQKNLPFDVLVIDHIDKDPTPN